MRLFLEGVDREMSTGSRGGDGSAGHAEVLSELRSILWQRRQTQIEVVAHQMRRPRPMHLTSWCDHIHKLNYLLADFCRPSILIMNVMNSAQVYSRLCIVPSYPVEHIYPNTHPHHTTWLYHTWT